MTMSKKAIGDFGEQEACDYITELGYEIVKRNYYSRFGEVDIIAKDRDVYVFIEVKTRKYVSEGDVFENINDRKLRRFRKTVEFFCMRNDIIDQDLRVDLIGVIVNKDGSINIAHDKDIWGW